MKTQNIIILHHLINKMVKETIKKDWRARRMYIDLSKASTEHQKLKIQEKIRDYFFNKRKSLKD